MSAKLTRVRGTISLQGNKPPHIVYNKQKLPPQKSNENKMPPLGEHVTVLLESAVEYLNIKPSGIYIDTTLGRGGHSALILKQLGPEGRLIAIDKDPTAIEAAQQLFGHDKRVEITHGSFTLLGSLVAERGLTGQINGILMDLGISSPQVDDATRGFSFMKEGPLDMRMDTTQGITAAQWLAEVKEQELADALWMYGDERFSRRIACTICQQREVEPLTTTLQLAELVKRIYPRPKPSQRKRIHPATRTFQAIRIIINQELDDLSIALQQAVNVLALEGRLVVISFHSLEDRIVKRFMRDKARGKQFPADLPILDCDLGRQLQRIDGIITPSDEEVENNPRARSAVMRVAEKIA